MKSSFLAVSIVALALPAWTVLGASVQLRLTHNRPGPDLDQLEIVHTDQNTALKELVFVDQKTLLDQSNVKSAQLDTAPDGSPRIGLALNGASGNLTHALRRDAGRRLAIVVDGRALATGDIVRPVQEGQVEIEGDFTKAAAQRIVDRINQATAQ